MFSVGERIRVITTDGLRFGGPIRAVEGNFLRLYDEHDQREIVLAISNVARAEVQR